MSRACIRGKWWLAWLFTLSATIESRGRDSDRTIDSVVAPGASTSQVDPILEGIRRQWDARVEIAAGAEYSLRGTALHTAGSIEPGLPEDPTSGSDGTPKVGEPPTDVECNVAITWLIDFRTGRFRKRSRDWSYVPKLHKFEPFVRDEVFDGTSLIGLWPKEDNRVAGRSAPEEQAEVIYWTNDDLSTIVNAVDLPLFQAHGLRGVSPGTVSRLSSLNSLAVNGTADIGGSECVVLEDTGVIGTQRGPRVSYFVDRHRSGAIVRVEVRMNEALHKATDVEYAKHDDVWLPAKWTCTYFMGSANPESNHIVTEYTLDVIDVALLPQVASDGFRLPLKPGMVVLRRDHDQRKERVGEDGRSMIPFEPHLAQSSDADDGDQRPVRLLALVAVNMAVIVGGIAFWLRRSRASARRRQSGV